MRLKKEAKKKWQFCENEKCLDRIFKSIRKERFCCGDCRIEYKEQKGQK